jgi:hypothetical protein
MHTPVRLKIVRDVIGQIGEQSQLVTDQDAHIHHIGTVTPTSANRRRYITQSSVA